MTSSLVLSKHCCPFFFSPFLHSLPFCPVKFTIKVEKLLLMLIEPSKKIVIKHGEETNP